MEKNADFELVKEEHLHFLIPEDFLRDIVKPEFHEATGNRKDRRGPFAVPLKCQTEQKVKKHDEYFTEKPVNVETSVKKHRLLQMLNSKNPRETIDEIRKEVGLLLEIDNKAVADDLHSALEKTETNLQSAASQN